MWRFRSSYTDAAGPIPELVTEFFRVAVVPG